MNNKFNTRSKNPKIKKAWEEAKQSVVKNYDKLTEWFETLKVQSQNSTKDVNYIIEAVQKNNQISSDFRKWLLGTTAQDKVNSALNYARNKETIENSQLSPVQKTAANFLSEQENIEIQNSRNSKGFLGDTMEKTADEFSNEMQRIILGYENFSEGMKSIGANMSKYMLNQLTDTLMKMIFTQQNAQTATNGAKAVGAGIWGFFSAAMQNIGTHHSGGIVPISANAQLPGTQEQLALLKGGERILSPSENTNYNNNNGGGASPVVFNNFNIKAWDSKDVRKYLLENKQLLNSITFEGIKNNNNHLRTMVRNA